MGNTLGPSPGATKHPNHRIDISENDGRWTVTVNGARVADSDATLVLNETNYKQVIYFPRQDVRTEQLIESASHTTCPFKGDAHYFAADIEGETQDVAWFYPAVYDEVAAIEGYVAFYTDRVELSSAK